MFTFKLRVYQAIVALRPRVRRLSLSTKMVLLTAIPAAVSILAYSAEEFSDRLQAGENISTEIREVTGGGFRKSCGVNVRITVEA